MAGSKNDPKQEASVDITTLQENLKGLEQEKNMLKEQKERIEAEKNNLKEELDKNLGLHTQAIKALEEKIKKLESEKQKLEEDKTKLEQKSQESSDNASENEKTRLLLAQVTAERDGARKDLQDAAQKHQDQVNSLKEEIKTLKAQKNGIVLNPFISAFLDALAAKLSKHYKKDVTPTSILEDYIIRYNLTEKYSLWFHDWVMTEKDAVEIAHQINPAIQTFKDVQKALNIN